MFGPHPDVNRDTGTGGSSRWGWTVCLKELRNTTYANTFRRLIPSATYVKLPRQFPCQGLDAGFGKGTREHGTSQAPTGVVGEPNYRMLFALGASCIARGQL